MATPRLTDEQMKEAVEAYRAHGDYTRAANALGVPRTTLQSRVERAAQRGMMLDEKPAMPGFRVSQVSTAPDGSQHVQQKPEHGDEFAVPAGHRVKGVSALVDAVFALCLAVAICCTLIASATKRRTARRRMLTVDTKKS